MTLEDYLERNARTFPDCLALVDKTERLTYAELWRRVGERALEMEEQRAKAGSAKARYVPFQTSQSVGFLVTYFAIHRAGDVAVPLEKDLPFDVFESLQKRLAMLTPPGGSADVLFTTGTTGKQKGVIISHEAVIANAENLIAAQGFLRRPTSAPLSYLLSGPLNHIGTLSKVWPTVLTAGTLYVLDGMKDFNAFFSAIEEAEGRVATFLVPATIRMLLRFCGKKLEQYREKIEFIETGAAPMAETDMRQLCQFLPETRLYNTYASTETGIIATYDYQQEGCTAGCLGRVMRHSGIEIAADGHIVCRGKTLMTGYVDAEMESPLRDGTLHTADLGYVDTEDRLHLTGRNDDVIIIGGYKVAPEEVENAALTNPMVKDCICIAVTHPVMGQMLQLLVVPNGSFDVRLLAQDMKKRLETYKVPSLYKAVDRIERTFNGKLNRKFYR